jgi:hypothetical protein
MANTARPQPSAFRKAIAAEIAGQPPSAQLKYLASTLTAENVANSIEIIQLLANIVEKTEDFVIGLIREDPEVLQSLARMQAKRKELQQSRRPN